MNQAHFWPLAVALVGAATWAGAGALSANAGAGFLLLPLLGGIVAISGFSTIAALLMFTLSIKERKWGAAISYAVLPLTFLLVAAQPLALLRMGARAGDFVHFELRRAEYMAEIQAMPTSNEPRLKLFSWGGWYSASDGVVYDESDEVVLPVERQSEFWRKRAEHTDLSCKGYFAVPMGQHFYLVHYPC